MKVNFHSENQNEGKLPFYTGENTGEEKTISSKVQEALEACENEQVEIFKAVPAPKQKSFKNQLPDIVQRIMEHNPQPTEELNFLQTIATLAAFGAFMPNTTFSIKTDEFIYPYIYLIAIGPAAGGKSTIKVADKIFKIHAARIYEIMNKEVEASKEAHKKWLKCTQKCKDKEDDCGCGSEPIETPMPTLIISAIITHSKMIQILSNNKPNCTLLLDTELDNATHTNKQDYGNLSPVLRKAYEFESLSSHTHIHGNVCVELPKICLILSGTPEQIKRFLVNKEDGLSSRCIFFNLSYQPYRGIAEFDDSHTHTDTFWKDIKPRIIGISQYFEKHPLHLTLSREGREHIDEYFRAKEESVLVYNDAAYISSTRRMRGILLRLAMVITALEAYGANCAEEHYPISLGTIDLVLSWADFLLAQSYQVCDMLPEPTMTASEGKTYARKVVFDRLPCGFESSIYEKELAGIPNYSKSTFKRDLKEWIKTDLLRKVKHGYYEKVNCQEEETIVEYPKQEPIDEEDLPF